MVKLGIPIDSDNGRDSFPSKTFGRAPKYYIADTESQNNDFVVKNEGEHFGGSGSPVDILVKHGISAMLTPAIGSRAMERFKKADIPVYKISIQKIDTLVDMYLKGELKEISEICVHDH